MYARAQEAEKRCFADNCAAASRMTEGSVREDIYRRLARFTVGLAHLLCLAHMLFPAAAAEPRVLDTVPATEPRGTPILCTV